MLVFIAFFILKFIVILLQYSYFRMEMANNSMVKILNEQPSTSHVLCPICSKKFYSTQLLNAHKKLHNTGAASNRVCRLVCPLCEERKEFRRHQLLRIHLKEEHEIDIELIALEFSNVQEYNIWFEEQRIEANYAKRTVKYFEKEEYKEIEYCCNRSDTTGYTSKVTKVTEKFGGSIKINGMCSSRLISTFYNKGNVSVSFWKTHVGHENELKYQHLTTSEKNVIVNKLKHGTPIDKILKDVRQVHTPEPGRINIMNRNDIYYLKRKHNINKIRDPYETIAVDEVNCSVDVVDEVKYSEVNGQNVNGKKNEEQEELEVDVQQVNEEIMKKAIWDYATNAVFQLSLDRVREIANKCVEMAKEQPNK